MTQDVPPRSHASLATPDAPPVHDLLGVPAALRFVDESEYAAILGAIMRPPQTADRGRPVAEDIAPASTSDSLSCVVAVSVLLELGVLVALLACFGS